MTAQKVLFIGLVWPEPNSSAAGTRIIQLVHLFKNQGYEIHFASAATLSDFSFELKSIGVSTHDIALNHHSFNDFIGQLNPSIVIFDRFMIEEQYGWRVQQECPDAIRMLDTEDLHFLRQARQLALKNHQTTEGAHLFNDLTKRELAAILRCDVSLIISEIEMEILQQQFKIDSSLLYYLPFLEEELAPEVTKEWNSYENREGFVFIGNYLHEPNWQTLQYLKTNVWPLLSQQLPNTSLNIYGAYASQKVTQLNSSREKFIVHGRAENARNAIAKHRILLAPLLFGAGAKGKFIDAMQSGTPIISTSVGAESMQGKLPWSGAIADGLEDLVKEAVKLYNDKTYWLNAQQNGIAIINQRYAKSKFEQAFLNYVAYLQSNLNTHRNANFIGSILNFHSLQSTRYMSLWIEEKNKNTPQNS
ncbi:glycosyltransferase [Pedobacter sp. ASV28]|uniref:glycosyltransferase n=1 Tax=Pedobacter sp. ASV28 TaxID=2795123 RepID=UPI0018EDDE33|nr:glycosyltransferase [Pedobacter sp. ASV28]